MECEKVDYKMTVAALCRLLGSKVSMDGWTNGQPGIWVDGRISDSKDPVGEWIDDWTVGWIG